MRATYSLSFAAFVLLEWVCACSSPGNAGQDRLAGPAEGTGPRVETIRPTRRDLSREISLPGSIVAFQQAVLYAKASGYLRTIHVDKGDRVRKGQTLAELEIPETAREKQRVGARLVEARADLEVKRLTFERLSQVREKEPDVISGQELDLTRAEMESAEGAVKMAEADEARLATLIGYGALRAPFSGVVTERFVDAGAFIQNAAETRQATPVVTVMDMSLVRLYMEVPDTAVPYIHEGTPVRLKVAVLNDRSFSGTVTRFASALNPVTRTMKVEADFPNPDGRLRHGMYGSATLTLEERHDALALPAESVLVEGGKSYVLVVSEEVVARRSVILGLDDGRTVEIRSGLEGDEDIIVGDRSALTEGMKVRKTTEPPPS